MTVYLLLFFGCPEPIVYKQDSIQPPDSKHMVKVVDDTHRQGSFWIDAIEYPNIPNQRPLANESFEQAKLACEESGKGCVQPKNGVEHGRVPMTVVSTQIPMKEIDVTPLVD